MTSNSSLNSQIKFLFILIFDLYILIDSFLIKIAVSKLQTELHPSPFSVFSITYIEIGKVIRFLRYTPTANPISPNSRELY